MSQSVLLDAISSQDGGLPEIELGKILADLIQIPDDDRGQLVGVQVTSGDFRDLIRCNSFDTRDKLRVVVVRQVEQGDLRDRARNLVERLEVSRVSPRQRRNADLQLLSRNRAIAPNRGDFVDRLPDGERCCRAVNAHV